MILLSNHFCRGAKISDTLKDTKSFFPYLFPDNFYRESKLRRLPAKTAKQTERITGKYENL